MKAYLYCLGMVWLATAGPAAAQTPNIDEIWEIVQQQQREIADLKSRLADADAQLAAADEKIEATGDYLDSVAVAAPDSATKIGGYGELH